MSRRLIILLVILLGLPLLTFAGLQWWLSSRFTVTTIAGMLEKNRSCRVTVDKVNISVFRLPSRMDITGLRAVPLGQADDGETAISMKLLRLDVSVWSLVLGELRVNKASLEGVEIKGVKNSRGNSLRRMLGRPDADTVFTPSLLEDADEWPEGAAALERPLNVSELPISSALREARISRVTFSLRDDAKRTLSRLDDLDVTLTGMALNPSNPAAGGSAGIRATARFSLERQSVSMRTLDFLLALRGRYVLFDPQSGDLNTDFDFQLTVRKGSILNQLPTLVRLNERLEKLKSSTGLDLQVPAEATLLADAPLAGHLKDGVITFTDDLLMPFDACELGLAKKSWLSVRSEEHQFGGHIAANAEFSAKGISGIEDFLQKKSPELARLVKDTVFKNLIGDDQRLHIPFESKGQISQPSVKAGDKLEDSLKDALKEAGKNLLDDALSGGNDLEDIFKSIKKKLKNK